MKKTISIIIFLSHLNCLSQDNLTLAFNFDTTKVFLKYSDLLPYLKKENVSLKTKTINLVKNDTLFLRHESFTLLYYVDTLGFDLQSELFTALDKKKGAIIYKSKPVSSFYTKNIKIRKRLRLRFKGIYYYDAATKKHFLTRLKYNSTDLKMSTDCYLN